MDSTNPNSNFSKMTNMIELFKSISDSNNVPVDENNTFEIDNVINSQEMNIIKASIPYMNLEVQKKLAVFVKFMELTKTMNLFTNNSVTEISELNKSNNNPQQLLQAIRSHCSEKNRKTIDIILNIYTLKTLMKSTNQPEYYQVAHNPNTSQQNSTNEDNLNQDELIEKLKNLINNN
jgi:hypothetical protein